ncbi:alpha-amylase family glycosyl hydrolase [Ornithinibacillus contaminans]|uniref:alpha-amylase family glycosyl hydrolase n=1 Tax=Ornithinibacillus contaminans TaxID=694055 RepID=UPI00064E014C|nr:alpha-amylase family glycosyl hydrolase [Ornithinibacillus contaminans]
MKKIALLFLAILLSISTFPSVSLAEENPIQQEIIYDIMVDRFNNGDQAFSEQVRLEDPYAYHGGDLKGIEVKLDELKDLGFTSISLSPIMANASDGYHGYWIEDFYTVEEQFGTMEDLQHLVEEAHKRDMKVMLELVTNYVASSHPIVSDPAKADWIVEDADVDTEQVQWLDNVKVLNQENPEVQEMLVDVAQFWLEEANVDGFILHAADEASSDFIGTLTKELKAIKPNLYIIADLLGEEPQEALLAIPGIDVVENPAFSEAVANVFSQINNPVLDIYNTWETLDNQGGLIYVDNKSMERFTQKAAENGRSAVNTWQLALTYLLTSPGVPSVFQGSDVPMYGSKVEEVQRLVDFNSGEAELEEVYSKVLALRKEFPVLQYGDYKLVGSDGAMSVFKRSYQDETMYIAINNDSVTKSVSLTDLDDGLQLHGLLGDDIVRQLDNGEYKIGLARETADVFIIEEDSGINWVFISPIIIVMLLFISGIVYLTRKQKKRDSN